MPNRHDPKRPRLGFWSVEFTSGAAKICPATAAMLGIQAGASMRAASLLLCVHPCDRQRLLRASLGSMRSGDPFDIVVRTADPRPDGSPAEVRILGGRGYDVSGRCEIHGILERVAAAPSS